MNELLKVDHLTVDFSTDQGTVHAVRDVSFCVYPQEVLGIVGDRFRQEPDDVFRHGLACG